MKFTFISKNGDILPLAQRIESEGNDVTFFLASEDSDYVIDRHISDIGPDIIIIDSSGFGRLSQKLKKLGFPVIGGSLLSDTLKNDANYHSKFLKACGLYTDELDVLPNSIPIDIEGWFNGKDFIAIIYTVNSVTFPGFKADKLYSDGLSRLVAPLKRNGYIGPISIKGHVNKDTIQYHTIKAGFTSSSMLAMLEGIKSNLSVFINGMASSSNRWVMFKPGFFISIQLMITPHDILESERFYNTHIIGLLPENLKHMWVYGVKKNGEGYVYNGNDGRFGVVTSRGDTISEARRRANRTIEGKVVIDKEGRKTIQGGIRVENMVYLKGVGNKADFQHSRLEEWKWIT